MDNGLDTIYQKREVFKVYSIYARMNLLLVLRIPAKKNYI